MFTLIGCVMVAVFQPIVTMIDAKLSNMTLWLWSGYLTLFVFGRLNSSTTEWIRPFVLQDVYSVLIGYICSQLIIERHKNRPRNRLGK